MIVKHNEQILTIHDAPYEDDAFEYAVEWDVDVIFTKGGRDVQWEEKGKEREIERQIKEEMSKGRVLGHFC